MKRLPLILALALSVTACKTTASRTEPSAPQPPVAPKIPHVTKIHGDRLVDNYFWLRKKNDPRVLAYLRAEDAYSEWFMKPTQPLHDALYKEMLGRIQETDTSVPYRDGQ